MYFLRLVSRFKRRAVISRLHKADIIVASPAFKRLSFIALLHRLMLRSTYVHSMLYIGNGKILHTTSNHGVVIHKVPGKIFSKKRYAIYRTRDISRDQKTRVIEEALKWHRAKIDHVAMFKLIPQRLFGWFRPAAMEEDKSLWCSRLIYRSFLSAGIDLLPDQDTSLVVSEDLANSPLVKRVF
ncbi:hypothetical protein GF407_16445 [candidate division KSB1 bacterium]|nr:hypothetical protein [candidate division KSB1 bacterium]